MGRAEPQLVEAPGPRTPIRVVIADDAYLMRRALEQVLDGVDEIEVVGAAADRGSLAPPSSRPGPTRS